MTVPWAWKAGLSFARASSVGVGAGAFVGGEDLLGHCGLAGLFAWDGGGDGDRDQLPVKAARSLRCESFLVAGERESVLIGAGDFVVAQQPVRR